ncbi:MAG TPA: GntR family transcriptional regulator [Acidimicrobiia bacterium]|nr:GntR family transcriptional regulator [Acidimicrobiia bacterium]
MALSQLKIEPLEENLSLTSRIYDALKAAISNMNIYSADSELKLDERRLSEQFGISRTPLREALARLDQEGLVRIVPRKGIYIVRKSKEEILEMITVWAALESMAARLITESATDKEISSLRRMFTTYEEHGVTAHIDEYSDTNIIFHQSILALAKNALLMEMANRLFMHVRAIRARTISENDRASRSIVDHLEIIEALEARDPILAERLVREHTIGLRQHVEAFVELD